ncbi:methyltransferase domain-containing protein, partial [bacterium]|nr:methyltransferase domain-containing protein [bacterium]
MLTILLGDYGSGKTATAKYLAKQTGGVYLNVDMLSQSNNNVDGIPLIEKLRSILKSGKDYYMDGYPVGYGYGMMTPERLYTDVKYIVCLAAPLVISHRQSKKAKHVSTLLPRTLNEIEVGAYHYASIALTYDSDPLFADTTTRPVTFWRRQDWLIRWMEICLYSALTYVREYQDVELSDRTVVGLSRSYKTWDRLCALVDFKGKKVVDYGCNYGYFCFKAEGAGASSVIGVDESPDVLSIAMSIALAKDSQAKFVVSGLKDFNPPVTDIIMALNVLHHLNYDSSVISKIFRHARTVVLEMPAKDLPGVDIVACAHHFRKPVVAGSHRDGRCIAIYSKAKPVVLPRKFAYHPRREALKWWLIRFASRR